MNQTRTVITRALESVRCALAQVSEWKLPRPLVGQAEGTGLVYRGMLVLLVSLVTAGLSLLVGSVAIVGHASFAPTHVFTQVEAFEVHLPLLLQRDETDTLPSPTTAEPPVTATPTTTSTSADTPTPTSSPTTTMMPTATLPPVDGYMFIEVYEDRRRGPGCTWRSAESAASYEFFPETGVLRLAPWAWFGLTDRDWGAAGCGWEYSGRGGGHSNYFEVFRSPIPITTRYCGVDIIDLSYGGRVTVKRQATGEEIGLGSGDQWTLAVRDEPKPGCVVTTTYRIANYGWQDRAKIERIGSPTRRAAAPMSTP